MGVAQPILGQTKKAKPSGKATGDPKDEPRDGPEHRNVLSSELWYGQWLQYQQMFG